MKPVMVRKVRNIFGKRQQGSAALITTIAISAILVVLFVGITSIATREISQSINSDNANRALYGAEAGVEDAVRRLTSDPGYRQNTCNDDANAAIAGKEVKVGVVTNGPDVAWTCRTVTTVSNELTGRLQKDEPLQINLAQGRTGLSDTDPFIQADYMTIEWNDPKVDSSTPFIAAQPSFLPQFPGGATDWQSRAALMEISATWMDAQAAGPGKRQINTGWLSRAGLNIFPVRTVLASPACTGASCSYSDFSPWNNAAAPAAPIDTSATIYQDTAISGGSVTGKLVSNITSQCKNNTSAEYNCVLPAALSGAPTPATAYDLRQLVKSEINNGTSNVVLDDSASYTSKNVVLRIRPRYAAASYRIKFYQNQGGTLVPVYLPDGYATIDVTARSSNYFRRVVAKKQITPGTYDGVFDNALFSGKDICKTMTIYRDFRGAPDYTLNGAGVKVPNADAGKNIGCTEG